MKTIILKILATLGALSVLGLVCFLLFRITFWSSQLPLRTREKTIPLQQENKMLRQINESLLIRLDSSKYKYLDLKIDSSLIRETYKHKYYEKIPAYSHNDVTDMLDSIFAAHNVR
jgi:hypothetical protein